jgi:Flp pilus assembly protein protease CpaA
MLEFMFFAALVGSLIAGLWDLKTTEIPDEIPTLMAALGLFSWFVYALTYGNFVPLGLSMACGTAFLAIGWALYRFGQWGGGDAKLMAGIGYLVPYFPGISLFPVWFFVNVFIAGSFYVIIYSVLLGLMNRHALRNFASDVMANWKLVFAVPVVISAAFVALMLYSSAVNAALVSAAFIATAFVMAFWRYAKVIEKDVFTRTVDAASLRVGDVLVDSKVWDGLSESQLAGLRKSRKKYVIKEGVRFGPVFFISLMLTMLYGNVLFLFI